MRMDFDTSPKTVFCAAACTVLILVLLAAILPGCATTLPAVGGRTVNEVELIANPDGSYSYTNKKKTPAGVDDTRLDEMKASIDPEGNWELSVAGDQTTDTTAQASMLTEISRIQMEAFQAGLDSALSALAPILGQAISAQVREGEIKASVGHHAIDALGGGR